MLFPQFAGWGPLWVGVLRALLPQQQQPHHCLLWLGQDGQGMILLFKPPFTLCLRVPLLNFILHLFAQWFGKTSMYYLIFSDEDTWWGHNPQRYVVCYVLPECDVVSSVLFSKVWNLANCKLKTNHIGHTGYLNTVTVSPDGSLCASGGKVWSTRVIIEQCQNLRVYSELNRTNTGLVSRFQQWWKLQRCICLTVMIKRLFLSDTCS